MPRGIPVPPRSIISDMPAWLEMCEFVVKLDNITSTFSTGEYTMEYLPEDVYLIQIDYKVITAFNIAASSEDISPQIAFGDSTDVNRFGKLSALELNSTLAFGSISLNYQDTSTGADLPALIATVDYLGLGAGAGDEISTQGEVELWLHYRVNADRDRKRGVRAK